MPSPSTSASQSGGPTVGATHSTRGPIIDASDLAPGALWVPGESSPLSDFDLHLFNEGTHYGLYGKLGCQLSQDPKRPGAHFAVWAPNARYVSVSGAFNGWDRGAHPLKPRGSSGIWEGFLPQAYKGSLYKYHVASEHGAYATGRADPYGYMHEVSPQTASVVWDIENSWSDHEWMRTRKARNAHDKPMSIYEVHSGSWKRVLEEGGRSLSYRELAHQLAEYCVNMGFTHVEFLPICEHPFFKSWGYQTLGYFAPTSRFGTPQDFMYLVDHLHQRGIGVIVDWVPSHFPSDEHGLSYFDGTHLYEHADPRQGYHPDWKSCIFNYGRNEVRVFLISSALFWLDKYHIDGPRVDAVASMLYLDYSRQDGEWLPNRYGGKENVDAIDFMRALNTEIYKRFPDTQTFAEESTAGAMVSAPTYVGGLGFGFKWDMGWMHDTLKYMARDAIHRKHHQNEITFRGLYMFSENYVLPLSHDEVVHMKGSLLAKMAGGDWQKFANLRLLYADQWAQPGKKLLFMGGEIGQWEEFNEERQCEWHLLQYDRHRGIQNLVRALNRLYAQEPALHASDCKSDGFRWVDCCGAQQSVMSFLRVGVDPMDAILVVLSFTPEVRHGYLIGAPTAGTWRELLNTDASGFGGSGVGNMGAVKTVQGQVHGFDQALPLTLPPLAALFLKAEV